MIPVFSLTTQAEITTNHRSVNSKTISNPREVLRKVKAVTDTQLRRWGMPPTSRERTKLFYTLQLNRILTC